MSRRSLDDSVQFVKGVGPKRALLLNRLGLNTVEDCLFMFPYRYEDRRRVQKVSQLSPDEHTTFFGEIINCRSFPISSRRTIFEMLVGDDSGAIPLKWFKFNKSYFEEKFQPGLTVMVSGKPASSRYSPSGLEMIHPDVYVNPDLESEELRMGSIIPVYRLTEGLHQKWLWRIMESVVELYSGLLEEFLPLEILKRHSLLARPQAIRDVHFPPADTDFQQLTEFRTSGHHRLIFEELFLIQCMITLKRKNAFKPTQGIPLTTRGKTIREFSKLLPFKLTGAQKRVLGDIMNDLERNEPMNRLLHGDVGSGKTLVALTSLLTAIDNGFQGALMAPTEILSEQHFLNLLPYCQKLGIPIDMLTSALPAVQKKKVLHRIHKGLSKLVVGTHALFQKDVEFRNLGLVVIDEQHRFGVLQRDALRKKGLHPHVLVMTATPIPRSLALTLYGDMDVSVINQLPPGRQNIHTQLFKEDQRDRVYDLLEVQLHAGRQAYIVCPMVEESKLIDLKNVQDTHEVLQKQRFPERTVALIHGKLKKEERQGIMSRFKAGDIDILVATTVIEVGIDVPNASVMVIEHSERFGLSQLHQLRGRVGRGKYRSFCFLIAYPPLTEEGKARLKAMTDSNDGFRIAEQDLAIRGPGDFMGTRQSGMPDLKIADIVRDISIIEVARKEAQYLLDKDATLALEENRALKITLHRLFKDRIELMNIL